MSICHCGFPLNSLRLYLKTHLTEYDPHTCTALFFTAIFLHVYS